MPTGAKKIPRKFEELTSFLATGLAPPWPMKFVRSYGRARELDYNRRRRHQVDAVIKRFVPRNETIGDTNDDYAAWPSLSAASPVWTIASLCRMRVPAALM